MEYMIFAKNKKENSKQIYASLLAVFGIFAVCGCIMYLGQSQHQDSLIQGFKIEEQEFVKFIAKHNKQYRSDEEYAKRFKIFRDNSAFIRIHNSMHLDWILGINQFSDLLPIEFSALYISHIDYKPPTNYNKKSHIHIPSAVDWKESGAVTDVKDQGMCGSCWAFSSTGAIEGAWKISKGELISLSEQQLVSCSNSYGNLGCNGGLMDYAFQYVKSKGITSEDKWPYGSGGGNYIECDSSLEKDSVLKISGFQDVEPESKDALMGAISKQPVSVAVEATVGIWQHYAGGVVTEGCGTGLDHGVLAVGYDSAADPPYYLIKNSWGNSWGLEGYIKLGISDGYGVCGINMMASYPVV
ncbi:unnamed protein product [Blepharisma stoltei]|uniref:Uncharacterized protein n=1 Tax=Blepharisma stoltei TaxID=1481888 RepID=A0AAU9IY77_9CILI|nr:unnamed protein product [Blepharisma stoltei]